LEFKSGAEQVINPRKNYPKSVISQLKID